MLNYFLRRLVGLVPMFLVISFISFTIIQLPPGDFVSILISQMMAVGDSGNLARAELLREQYGLNDPFLVRYWNWLSGILVGDFGVSAMFEGAEVADLIGTGFLFTILLGGISLVFAWSLAIAIGIYSATHRYGIADYSFTFLGFIGLAVPPFLTSILYVFATVFIFDAEQVGGLYSVEFRDAPPVNRLRFISLFAMVFTLSILGKHQFEPTNLTAALWALGNLIGNGIDFPYSPVRLVIFSFVRLRFVIPTASAVARL